MRDDPIRHRVEDALRVLVGERLWAFGRAHTLWWLHFGERREVPEVRRGEVVGSKTVGAYALHLTCAWRVVGGAANYVGSGDLYLAAGEDPYRDWGTFDWARQGANRADDLVGRLLAKSEPEGLLVESVEVGQAGAFRLVLGEGFMLDVLPNRSVGEYWRLLRPGHREDHFVVAAHGIGS